MPELRTLTGVPEWKPRSAAESRSAGPTHRRTPAPPSSPISSPSPLIPPTTIAIIGDYSCLLLISPRFGRCRTFQTQRYWPHCKRADFMLGHPTSQCTRWVSGKIILLISTGFLDLHSGLMLTELCCGSQTAPAFGAGQKLAMVSYIYPGVKHEVPAQMVADTIGWFECHLARPGSSL